MPVYEQPTIPEDAKPNGINVLELEVERIDYTNGINIYIKGHKYPFKGLATEPAINAIAVIKKLLRFQPLSAMWEAIRPHILKDEFQQPITRELCKMFPNKLGITIAHVIELDSAYRYFIMDLASETTNTKLLKNPWREVRRLLTISARRLAKNPDARKKIHYFGYIFLFLLYIPKIRKAFRECDFTKLQPDPSDVYWIRLRQDYIWDA